MESILLSEKFGNNIFTRNTIFSFMSEIEKTKEKSIVLDFKGIEFISRSCADEYLKIKKESKKKIVEKNMSKNVIAMFHVVLNQYKEAGLKVFYESGRSLIAA